MFHQAMLLVPLSVLLCGCGTVANMTLETPYLDGTGYVPAPQQVFGGVEFDAYLGRESFEEGSYPLAAYWLGVDLPMSLIGDTLTLPLTIFTSQTHIGSDSRAIELDEIDFDFQPSKESTVSRQIEWKERPPKHDRIEFNSMSDEEESVNTAIRKK